MSIPVPKGYFEMCTIYRNTTKSLKKKNSHGYEENLAVFQKGVQYSGIKVYTHLPQTLKQLSHDIPKFNL
jgi:hypothetical protein